MVTPKIGLNTTKDYFNEVVEPNYDEYKSRPDIRTTLNAAWSLWHTHDWYYWEYTPGGSRKKCSKFGDDLTIKYKEMLYLRDIAETGKHFNLVREGVEVNKVAKRMRGVAGIGPAGVFNPVPRSAVMVETENRQYELNSLFAWAFDFWRGHVAGCGDLIASVPASTARP